MADKLHDSKFPTRPSWNIGGVQIKSVYKTHCCETRQVEGGDSVNEYVSRINGETSGGDNKNHCEQSCFATQNTS